MPDKDKYKEICELLTIWFYLRSEGTVWPKVIAVLESRINLLCSLEGIGNE